MSDELMPRADPSWFVRATDGQIGVPDDLVRGRHHLIGGVTPPLPLRRIDQPPSSPKVLALLRHLQVMAAVVLMDGVRPREQEVASGDEGPFVIPDLVLGLGPDPAGLMEHPEQHLPDRLGPAINPAQGPADRKSTRLNSSH